MRLTAMIGAALVAGLAFAGSALAQDAPAPAAGAPQQAARPAPPRPEKTETITAGRWQVTCQTFKDEKLNRCAAMLRVADEKTKRVVLAWQLSKEAATGRVQVAFEVPPGTLIQKGVELRFGDGLVRRVPYITCNRNACEASAPLDNAAVKEMLAAKDATATIYARSGKAFPIKMPQDGIDQAVEAVRK